MYNNVCTRCKRQFPTGNRRNYLCRECRSVYDRIASGWRVADVEINNIEDAREVVCNYSYSPNEWDDGYRNNPNHIQTNFLVIEFDERVTIDQAKQIFQTYQYIIISSRHHQKIKPGRESQGINDRFHVILPL